MVLLDTMGTFEKHKDMIYARGRAHILFRTRAVLICMKNRYLNHITQIQAYHAHTAAAMLTTCIIYCFGVSSVSPTSGIFYQLVIFLITVMVLQGLDVQA